MEWYDNQLALCEKLPELPGSPAVPFSEQSLPSKAAVSPSVESPDRTKSMGSVVLENARSAPAASLFPSVTLNDLGDRTHTEH
jgi:hypothetical protein